MEKEFSSTFCGQSCSVREGQERHVLSQSVEKAYLSCDCRKNFSKPGHVTLHHCNNTGENPSCPACEKMCSPREKVEFHKRPHAGEEHQCFTSGKDFSQSGTANLPSHVECSAQDQKPHDGQCNPFPAESDLQYSDETKKAAPCQTGAGEARPLIPDTFRMESGNMKEQSLHLTVRLQEEEGEDQEEETGGLINSDGEMVEWDTGDSPNHGSDNIGGPQSSKAGGVLSESQLQSQNQTESFSPALIMEVVTAEKDGEKDAGEEKKRVVKMIPVSSSIHGKRNRTKIQVPEKAEVPINVPNIGKEVPATPVKRRSRRKISNTPLLSVEHVDREPGNPRCTRRKRVLPTKVESDELNTKAARHTSAKRHYRSRKVSTPSAEGEGETTAAPAKRRPGRKMVCVPTEIPPELLKMPKEKIDYHCSVCGKEFPHAYKLERHKLIHTSEKPYCCSLCGRGFNQKGNLKTHYKVHLGHKSAEDWDNEVNPIASELSEYLKSLPGESRIRSSLRCLECGRDCENLSVLQAHITTHSQMTAESDTTVHSALQHHFCRHCGVTFKDKEVLEEHMKRHVKEKRFSCPDCGKRFINESYVQVHQRIHTGEKPFLCSQCGKGFFTASSLKLHEMQHSGERPFSCEICGKTFRMNSYLTAHYQTHLKERPFCCSICGKGYSRAEELKVHTRLHTGERPYQCGECGKSFIYRQGLRQHQRTHAGRRMGPTRQLGRPKQQPQLDIF
ncbi:hypothetical protein LDENG_00237290 [Lucifuga dentata]|nr:hypothetical protein LDENG_00237290 [Lucifuga dentata]